MLAGYKRGPRFRGECHRRGVPPFPETQNYVKTIRELADTKYKLTCSPDYHFKQAKLSFVNGVTPAMAGVHADGYAAIGRGVGERGGGFRLGVCERLGSSVCERFCGFFGEAFGDEFRPLNSAF